MLRCKKKLDERRASCTNARVCVSVRVCVGLSLCVECPHKRGTNRAETPLGGHGMCSSAFAAEILGITCSKLRSDHSTTFQGTSQPAPKAFRVSRLAGTRQCCKKAVCGRARMARVTCHHVESTRTRVCLLPVRTKHECVRISKLVKQSKIAVRRRARDARQTTTSPLGHASDKFGCFEVALTPP